MGAAAVLASRPVDEPCVVVDDVTEALARLATHVLGRLDPVVIAITGSQGKTSVKDLLADGARADAARPSPRQGSFNNELGVPLTVLRADERDPVPRGRDGRARRRAHRRACAAIAPPDIAVVLNVGTAHVGEFGSPDVTARAKGEIVEALRPGGTAVLNADDPRVAAMASRTSARVAHVRRRRRRRARRRPARRGR